MTTIANPILKFLIMPLYKGAEWLGNKYPILLVKLRYLYRFKKFPNLKEPKDLNEKILYLKLFSDTKVWSELADKYLVREYVKSLGLSDILVPLYGVWDSAEDFSLKELPLSFVLKANNGDGKGSNLLIEDSRQWEEENLKKIINIWLSNKNIGSTAAEPHYKNIKPRVLAEKLLPIEKNSTSLVDYKIWCFNGEPFSILTCSNRKNDHVCLGCYDLDWNYHPENMLFSEKYSFESEPLKKPLMLKEMLAIAKILSKPFPQVRVDLYEICGKIYFGEMTFTSLGGMMNYYTPEYLLVMGDKIDVNFNK